MTPAPQCQPKADETRRFVNGEFYAKRDKIFRAPIETKTETGTSISVGFPVCHVSDYVDPDNLVECLNASREVDTLKARIQELDKLCQFHERTVEMLESNARVQAKLLADTGRRAEELEGALRQARTFIDPEADPPGFGNREMVRLITAALEAKPAGEMGND